MFGLRFCRKSCLFARVHKVLDEFAEVQLMVTLNRLLLECRERGVPVQDLSVSLLDGESVRWLVHLGGTDYIVAVAHLQDLPRAIADEYADGGGAGG